MSSAYVVRGGEQVLPGPFLQADCRLHNFLVRADRDRLEALCTRTFTTPTGGAVRVRPLGDTVMISFADIGAITCLDPVWRDRGQMAERDVTFWVPISVEHAGTRFVAWFIPYIFVDAPPAVATGREHYGFPKAAARLSMPTRGAAPYAVDTAVLTRFARETVSAEARLLDVVRGEGDGPGLVRTLAAVRALTGEEGLLGSLRSLADREMPVLFLRQLRDIADPNRAAYTEVLVAPARPTAMRDVGLLPGEFTLRVHPHDSHPIAAELGLPTGAIPIEAAYRVDLDFEMGLGRTLWSRGAATRPQPARKKIAVLGGGLGAMSAVYEITDQPGWEERYDITVYQMGFRLGGKGASGRNADAGQRIEEHGLHIWFGFYENGFRLMRRCFAEAARAPGTPLATWQDAFRPHSHIVVQEEVHGRWIPWSTDYPTNDKLPGEDAPELTTVELIRHLARWSGALLEEGMAVARRAGGGSWLGQAAFSALVVLVRGVQKLALAAVDDPDLRDSRALSALTDLRRRLWALVEDRVEAETDLRRAWIGIDFALTNLYGVLRDGVLEHGFGVINRWDYLEWLERHGASEMTRRSAPIRCGYDLVFGFEGGDTDRPNMAAGVGLYGLLRMFFTYKGAVCWKMQAGMGDVVFTPLYEVLRKRGVTFRFFEKVEELALSADGARIGSIRMARQATVRGGEYHPLVRVKGIDCWPDRPLYEQLVEGDALRGIDLESSHSGWEPVERHTLREGVDFDEVILGIPVGALRHICKPLIAARREWRGMVESVTTVCTHAVQLWTRPDLAALGWTSPLGLTEAPLLGAYAEPTDTWSDMTHLVPVEDWPAAETPGHVAYFCGPLRDPEEVPAAADPAFPRREHARVAGMARHFLDHDVHRLWPAAVDTSGRFRDDLLVEVGGVRALHTQFIKANVEPTDRYTLSRKGTIQHRLRADRSGFTNLFLAGDWIDNGFNAGCVEATVMSGMQCARAVTGANIWIHGENHRLRPAGQQGPRAVVDRADLALRGAGRGARG